MPVYGQGSINGPSVISAHGGVDQGNLRRNLDGLLGSSYNTGMNLISPGIEEAVGVQRGLREELGPLLYQLGQGQQAALDQRYTVAQNNLAGSLAQRGLGGSNLAAVGALDLEGQRADDLSGLMDQILGAKAQSHTGISNKISDLYNNAGRSLGGFLSSILGGAGTGTIPQTETITRQSNIYDDRTL